MSAAVVQEQELIWAQGFGYADLENQVEATADTPYGLASVTKPIAATLLMQFVEEGLIDLDTPVRDYGVKIDSEGVITVRHLLTHVSEGVPGTTHNYNGNRYALLGGVLEAATGRSFAELLSERFLLLLDMKPGTLSAHGRDQHRRIWKGLDARSGGEEHSGIIRTYIHACPGHINSMTSMRSSPACII
jgi:CubicO group peptidase (beta-lactamase class C family)